MEAPETFVIIKRWWILKFRSEEKEETKEDNKSWIVPLAAIGLIVIVIGIAVETFAEGKVSDVDALLRAHESDKITEAENEATSAIREAGNAKNSAVIAESAAGVAKGTAEGAESLAETAKEKAVSANDEVSVVQKQADVLAYFLSARRVQDEIGLEDDLRKEYTGSHIVFDSYVGDEEAYWLCWQLVDIAHKAGVDFKDECATKQLSKNLPIVDLHISAPTIDEGRRLSMIFKKPKRVPGYQVGLNEGTVVTVTVGVKPSTPLFPMVNKAENKKSVKQ